MSRRRTYEIPGVDHGSAPIPMAARVGNLFQSSGISGRDPGNNELPEDGVAQVDFAFANARTLLDVAGVGLDEVVFLEVLLKDDSLRGDVNRHWLEWYPDEHDRPARHTTVRDLPGRLKMQLRIEAWTESTK
ncbi:RidA family protein [Streptosporangium sp. NPDC001559]|uniref:RidA family protein n=1 Tax=Streptosporangium sp. NPDC001559 TaxID=3366187 RepID=UPI0036E8E3AF